MSFLNVSKCPNQPTFMVKLNDIEYDIYSHKVIEKSQIDKISQFFENNMDYLTNDKTLAIRLDSIATQIRFISSDDPFIGKLQSYVGKLLPAKSKEEIESSRSVLKEHAHNYLHSLAEWVNLMEIPLSSLNLSDQELYNLTPS